MKFSKWSVLLILVVMVAGMVSAQEDDMPLGEVVQIDAADGLTLVGDYYAQIGMSESAPAVLLLHMLGSNREAWEAFISPLYDAGYAILAVDMRGHGDTGGTNDWTLAETDIQIWLDWLRTQEGVRTDAVSIIGASIGSNLALIGCANDSTCVTAIALSPGQDYRGVQPAESVASGLAERSALLVGSYSDGSVVRDILAMVGSAQGEIGTRFYPGRVHGTNLLASEGAPIMQMMIAWLDEHLPEAA